MNDGPRLWWNVLDKALCSYGMIPTRADRCCYVLYSSQRCKPNWNTMCSTQGLWYKRHLTRFVFAITGRCSICENVGSHWRKPSYWQIRGRNNKPFCRWSLRNRWNRNGTACPSQTLQDFQVGSEDWNDVLFTGQWIRWMKDPQSGPSIEVGQERAIEGLEEIPAKKNIKRRSPLYSCNAYKVKKLFGTEKLVTEQDTVPVLLLILQMCFKGSFSNRWWCEGSQQAGDTTQIAASETSILATHRTVENSWISWCLLPKQWWWVFTERHGSAFRRTARPFLEGWNVIWKFCWLRRSKDW